MKAILVLSKFWLSVSVAITTIAGFLIYQNKISLSALYASLGVFFLSAAAATLNQIQERNLDSKMKRTKMRPIPDGVLSLNQAIILFISFVFLGSFLLLLDGNLIVFLLGIGNLMWYNLVYTPLKKITAFAAVPGGLCGAIPPIIGWVAAGGSPHDQLILVLALFMFMWQIPHFWLVILKHGEDYQKVGFKSLTSIMSFQSVRNLTFVWGLATSIGAILLGLYGLIFSPLYKIILLTLFVVFTFTFFVALYRYKKHIINYSLAFASINSFMILVLLIAVLENL